jgi:hypothetical protein
LASKSRQRPGKEDTEHRSRDLPAKGGTKARHADIAGKIQRTIAFTLGQGFLGAFGGRSGPAATGRLCIVRHSQFIDRSLRPSLDLHQLLVGA